MEIIIFIALVVFATWWFFMRDRNIEDSASKQAPYKVETPPTLKEEVPSVDAAAVGMVAVAAAAAPVAEAAPAKKPRKPRAPKAEKPAKEKAAAKKPAAKKTVKSKKA